MSIIITDQDNKRLVKKSKQKTDTMNIKISTEDKDMNINISTEEKDIKTKEKTPREDENKIKSNYFPSQEIEVGEEEEDKEERQIQKTVENTKKPSKKENQIESLDKLTILGDKLKEIEAKRLSEKKDYLEECQKLNEEILLKNKEAKKLGKQIKKILSKLMEMKDNLDEKVNSMNIMKKKEEKIKTDNELKVGVNAADKEKQVMQKNMDYEEKEINNLNKKIEENKEGKETELYEKLKELADKIKYLNTELISLKTVQSQHNYCNKYLSQMRGKLNILSNEVEFETKKQIMLDTSNNNNLNTITDSSKENINLTSPSTTKKGVLSMKGMIINNKVNRGKVYGNNIKIKKVSEKKTRNLPVVNKSYVESVINRIDITNKIGKKSATPKKNLETNDKGESNLLYNKLFTEEEYQAMEQLIPVDYLNNYSEKYSNLYNQAMEIREKMKGFEEMKTELCRQKNNLEDTEQKKKIIDRSNNTLTMNLSKYKKESTMYSKKTKQLQKLLKEQNDVLEGKNKQNEELKTLLNTVQNKIKRGRLILKKSK